MIEDDGVAKHVATLTNQGKGWPTNPRQTDGPRDIARWLDDYPALVLLKGSLKDLNFEAWMLNGNHRLQAARTVNKDHGKEVCSRNDAHTNIFLISKGYC